MTKLLTMRIDFTLFLFMVLAAASPVLQAQTEIEWPYIEAQTNYSLWIKSIELGDQTVIELEILNVEETDWKYSLLMASQANNHFYLEDPVTGETYPIVMIDSINRPGSVYRLSKNETRKHRLYFPSLPADTRVVNLIGAKKDNFWDFRGIDLTGKAENVLESMKRCVGRRAHKSHRVKKDINWFISETYNFDLVVDIKSINEDLVTQAYIIDILIVDPKMASINYMDYRDQAMRSVASNIGETAPINAAMMNFEIWD